ncbi:MAG: ABC transporter transmembrane domain-containing protein [Alphaproteobacteria bacterium]
MDELIERSGLQQAAEKPLRLLWPLVRPYRVKLALGAVAMLVSAAGMLAIGQGLREIVDRAFADHSGKFLNDALLILLCVILLMAGASFVRLRLIYSVAERVISDLRKQVYAHLLSLDPAFFEQHKTGDQVSRISADTTVLQLVITTNLPMVFRHGLMMIGGLVMLCVVSPHLTLTVLVVVPLVVGPVVYFGRRVRARSRDTQSRVGDVGAYSQETLQGIQTIQSFGYEDEAARKFGLLADEVYDTAMKYVNFRALLTAYVIATVMSAIGVVLWRGGYQVLAGEMTPGDLSAFIFYSTMVAGAVTAISEALSDFSRAGGAADRIMDLLNMQSGLKTSAAPRPLPEKIRGEMEFRNVTFRYPARPEQEALQEASFRIAPGEVVALVGPSGAGKTTIFQLLQRFYDPASGSVCIDGINVAECDPRDVRHHLSVVSQDPTIFSMSVAENIRMAKPEATDDEVRRAAELAQAHDFISGLSLTYGTMVGERGNRLSGGQKQRIAIARAILKDTKILLLDEATSALDAANEIAVHKALKNLMQGRTTLIIAHRLSTVQNADRIIVMDNGRIVAEGSHAQLYAQKGLYAHLAGLQMDLKAS